MGRANDLRAFRGFIGEQLSNGGADLTLDEALSRWELENMSEEEREGKRKAIRRGFADIKAGRVRPAREALAELRMKHNLPPLS